MFRKRGQLTVFVVVGIVILLVIALGILFLRSGSTPIGGNNDPGMEKQFKEYLKICLSDAVGESVFAITEKGGVFDPVSGIEYQGKKYNILTEYQTDYGYQNNLFLLRDLEIELSKEIQESFKSCVDYSEFEEKGYKVSDGIPKVKTTITDESVIAELDYPLTIKKGNQEASINDLSDEMKIEIKDFFKIAIDIVNSEAKNGYFDKDSFMLNAGSDFIVEKFRPYPHTIYRIKKHIKESDKDMIFQFAIKGADTVGDNVLHYKNGQCCFDMEKSIGYQNVNEDKCKGANTNSKVIPCGDLKDNFAIPNNGCCKIDGECKITSQTTCNELSGSFNDGDRFCTSSGCGNLNCKATYDYVTDSMKAKERPHGKSWCSYDAVAGKGLDYVGSRHYLHSCINGVEYIEPCRDYREELCTEEKVSGGGSTGAVDTKAMCRINRWYDCSAQLTKDDCLDNTRRDCIWAEQTYGQLKCHPEVPPGLKVWESGNEDICNIGNLLNATIHEKAPKLWLYSSLTYCQRLGDCGNYRNVADVISKQGFFYSYGEPEPWIYWEEGLIEKGDNYVIDLGVDNDKITSSTRINKGNNCQSGNCPRCGLWVAPAEDKCDECTASSKRPCTEYKCKSLGKHCKFNEQDSSCSTLQSFDSQGPKISITEVAPEYSFETKKDDYFREGFAYHVNPEIEAHSDFDFKFKTDEESKCKVSISPPYMNFGKEGFLTSFLLNDYGYKSEYDVTIRFPSSTLTQMNEYQLYIRCYDKEGNDNEVEHFMVIKTTDVVEDLMNPQIIRVSPAKELLYDNSSNRISLYVNEPYTTCKYSFDSYEFTNMIDTGCSGKEEDIMYMQGLPLGSYPCNFDAFIQDKTQNIYLTCEDLAGNRVNKMY